MAEKNGKSKKTKRPSALKRDIRNAKAREVNKAFKSGVRTSIRSLEEALKGSDQAAIKGSLQEVYSAMDKGVKRGIYKVNKAARTKARYALLAQKAS